MSKDIISCILAKWCIQRAIMCSLSFGCSDVIAMEDWRFNSDTSLEEGKAAQAYPSLLCAIMSDANKTPSLAIEPVLNCESVPTSGAPIGEAGGTFTVNGDVVMTFVLGELHD